MLINHNRSNPLTFHVQYTHPCTLSPTSICASQYLENKHSVFLIKSRDRGRLTAAKTSYSCSRTLYSCPSSRHRTRTIVPPNLAAFHPTSRRYLAHSATWHSPSVNWTIRLRYQKSVSNKTDRAAPAQHTHDSPQIRRGV
jgi:hypothetical protein